MPQKLLSSKNSQFLLHSTYEKTGHVANKSPDIFPLAKHYRVYDFLQIAIFRGSCQTSRCKKKIFYCPVQKVSLLSFLCRSRVSGTPESICSQSPAKPSQRSPLLKRSQFVLLCGDSVTAAVELHPNNPVHFLPENRPLSLLRNSRIPRFHGRLHANYPYSNLYGKPDTGASEHASCRRNQVKPITKSTIR